MKERIVIDYNTPETARRSDSTPLWIRIMQGIVRVSLAAEAAMFMLVFAAHTIEGTNQLVRLAQFVSPAIVVISIVLVFVCSRPSRLYAIAFVILAILGAMFAWSLPFRNI